MTCSGSKDIVKKSVSSITSKIEILLDYLEIRIMLKSIPVNKVLFITISGST